MQTPSDASIGFDPGAVFWSSPSPYLILNPALFVVEVNPAYEQVIQRGRADLVGKYLFDIFPDNPDDPTANGSAIVRNSMQRVLQSGVADNMPIQKYDIEVGKSGESRFEEHYWRPINAPIFDDQGNVTHILHFAENVTARVKAENAVRESERRFRALTNATADVIYRMSPDWKQMYGLDGRGFLKDTVAVADYRIEDYVPPEDQELAGDAIKKAIRDKAVFALEHRVLQADGRHGWTFSRAVPLLDAGGEIVEWIGAASDISERKAMEVSLHESNRRKAFELELSDSIRQLSNPEDVKAAACALLGRRLNASRIVYAEVDNDRGTIFMRQDWTAGGFASVAGHTKTMNDFGPDSIADLRCGIAVINNDVETDRRTAEHADAFIKIGVRAEIALPLIKGGELRVVLAIHSAEPRTWQEEDLELAREMAERTWSAVEATQAQANLRLERDQSQYIFDSMAEGFALLDRHWTILRMNAEGLRITQRSAGEIIGQNHWDVFPELKGTDTEVTYRRVMETGKTAILEVFYTWPDGKNSWMEIRAHPSLDGGIAFFFRDVTERHSVQDQLKIADRRKDEFLAMLAHELRNPLAPIGAAAHVLQMAKLDDARILQTSQIIGRQVEHMTRLVDDLLDVSRVTRGLVEMENEPLDIRHIVTDAVEQITPLMQARRHHLSIHLPPETTMVTGDKKRLVQVLANILNNAAKYTNEGGNIALKTEVQAKHVLFVIRDNGIGMATELADHAFDLFAQAERAADRSSGGLGLGLALVKNLVELHQGTVSCHSDGIGQGSEFTVCLPRLVAEDAIPLLAVNKNTLQLAAKSLRIMVVDDNVDAAFMLSMLLETLGHQVTVEHRSPKALERAKVAVPDVCVLDIGLPEIDGNELAQRLRKCPETARVKLIALTGYGQENDREKSLAAGFDHHLVKPVDMNKLAYILADLGS